MLYTYARNRALAGLLSGPGMASLGEPRIDRGGVLSWRFEGAAIAGLTEVVPSFSDIGSSDLTFRFVVRASDDEGSVSEIGGDWLGGLPNSIEGVPSAGPLTLDVDTVRVSGPLGSLEVRLECAGSVRPSRDAVIGISLRGPRNGQTEDRVLSEGALGVPVFSQFEQSAAIGHRICSPTAVAMVLRYYGFNVSPLEVAERSYAAKHDLYGVWPSNIWAAAGWGAAGCLMHIDSWSTVDHLFRHDVPVIASIRYRRSDLRGAAFYRDGDERTGHLVVVCGSRGEKILVNDPAGRTPAEVNREYDRGEFARVWFEQSAMGYILVPPRVMRRER